MLFRILIALVSVLPLAAADALPSDHAERMTRGLASFQTEVKKILVENCVNCHGGEKTKGELNMITRESLLRGGVDGVMVVPFKASESRLLKLVRHQEEPHMPHEKQKLADDVIGKLAAWIDDGAPYEGPLLEGKAVAKDKSKISAEDRSWWAFQPLKKSSPPNSQGVAHPIDQFIGAKAAEKNLKISSPAERTVLIRRLYLDLLGIPPAPEEIDAFAKDTAPDAWDRLIDRTLASPHFGERWARHWLDVARFAESSGFEHDYDREGAYQFRDFVIRAFNSDMPYDQFLKWQIAGDEFEPGNALALTATGFLGAGVFPTQITANEVERTRYDAMDDMLSTTSLAFMGLTVGCARCHDHKFDPFPAADYYKMLSTFTTTTRSVIEVDLEPEKTDLLVKQWARVDRALEAEWVSYEHSLIPKFETWVSAGAKIDGPIWNVLELTNLTSKAGATFKNLEDGSWLAEGKNGDQDEYTFQASAGASITGLRLDALSHSSMPKNGPGRADNGNIGLSRIRIYAGTSTQEVKILKAAATFEQNTNSLSIAAALDEQDNTGWAVDPQFGKGQSAIFKFAEPVSGPLTIKLEFKVNKRHNIGRPRLSVISGSEPTLDGAILPPNMVNLLARADRNFSRGEKDELFEWWKARDTGWRERRTKFSTHNKQRPTGLTKALVCAEGYPPLRMHSQGADFFNETHFLRRGNTDLKNGVASQDFLQVLMRAPEKTRWTYQPPRESKFSGRRRSLATWMTDVENGAGAQVARVIVNRLWQHHFGQAIVPTPNDFGRAGALPSHPELLDYLAAELIRNDWKLKSIHKLILTSATYQQNTKVDSAKAAADPDNRLFVRRLPRRLEGEAIRDSVLAVSGVLDRTMFGPGTKDEKSKRRSIYFTIKRSQLVGSMVVFDLPEPLVSQASRPTTTVAPQALFLMNAPQVRDWAKSFAQRLASENSTEQKVIRAFRLAVGRAPTEQEKKQSIDFINSQSDQNEALTDFCQVVFGLNEFAYEN